MSVVVKIGLDKTKKVFQALAKMQKLECLVGVPAGGSRNDGGQTNSEIAFINEFGAPARRIPARPFLNRGIDSVKAQTISILRAGAAEGLQNPAAIDKTLNKVGLINQVAIKKAIVDGAGFAPLSPRTLAARKNRGTKPLLNTKQLLNSITYVIRNK